MMARRPSPELRGPTSAAEAVERSGRQVHSESARAAEPHSWEEPADAWVELEGAKARPRLREHSPWAVPACSRVGRTAWAGYHWAAQSACCRADPYVPAGCSRGGWKVSKAVQARCWARDGSPERWQGAQTDSRWREPCRRVRSHRDSGAARCAAHTTCAARWSSAVATHAWSCRRKGVRRSRWQPRPCRSRHGRARASWPLPCASRPSAARASGCGACPGRRTRRRGSAARRGARGARASATTGR